MAASKSDSKPPMWEQMLKDFAAGGIRFVCTNIINPCAHDSGTVSKTLTAPIERVKLIIQTQDANPKIVSGEVPRYTGIGNTFSRVASEQGMSGALSSL